MKNCIVWGNGRIAKSLKKSLIQEKIKYSTVCINTNTTKLSKADCIIDFSNANATKKLLSYATTTLTPLVIGTTGQNAEQMQMIYLASQTIPICICSNFTYGIICIRKILPEMTKLLNEFDTAISEIHQINKKDAPSGTAKMLANYLINPQITFLRLANHSGEHKIYFSDKYQSIEITHTTYNIDAYAEGAIKIAKNIIDRQPKLYDVCELI
ncbi:MAG: dihydrodipicolinate reductase C-terminal domain-containing protein [Clostridia bacterium]